MPQPQPLGAASSRPIAGAYTPAYQSAPLPISNRASWLSLGFGGLSVIILITRLAAGTGTIVYTTAGLAAIVWGIVALIRVHARRATVVWAPIVGIVLGTISSVLIAVALVLVATHPNGLAPAANQGQTDQGPPPLTVPETLQSERAVASNVSSAIEMRYNNGARLLGAGKSWPAHLNLSQGTNLTDDAGTFIATQPVGYRVSYENDGSGFQLSVTSVAVAATVKFDSATSSFEEFCGPVICGTDGTITGPGPTT
jgi:hypothetical protein